MQINSIVVSLVIVTPAWAVQEVEAPVVVNPHVKTDKSVDFRTIGSIIDSVVKEGMKHEEKVLAIFHAIRRRG